MEVRYAPWTCDPTYDDRRKCVRCLVAGRHARSCRRFKNIAGRPRAALLLPRTARDPGFVRELARSWTRRRIPCTCAHADTALGLAIFEDLVISNA